MARKKSQSILKFIIAVYYHSVTLLASCVMKLQNFPLDSQTCHLKIGSCKYCVPSFSVKLLINNIYKGKPVLSGHLREMAK